MYTMFESTNTHAHTFYILALTHTWHALTHSGQSHQEICDTKYCWSSCHSRSVRSLGLRRWVTTYHDHFLCAIQSSWSPVFDHFRYANTVAFIRILKYWMQYFSISLPPNYCVHVRERPCRSRHGLQCPVASSRQSLCGWCATINGCKHSSFQMDIIKETLKFSLGVAPHLTLPRM